jgi:hypothetical protein
MSLFLIVDIEDKRDDVLEAADINNGDNAEKKSINNRDDTFKAVEEDGDDSNTNKATPFDGFNFFKISSLTYHSVCPLQSSFWCGRVCLCHGLLNKRLLEMRMFGV